jgi:hypothetical protein
MGIEGRTMKRRRLSDLYVVGTVVRCGDGTGEPIDVWVNKLNDIDRESAIRRANAAKARYLMEAADEDGELFQAAWGQVREFDDRDALVAVVIADDVVRYRRKVEAELGADEETWGKDGYLQGLVDAWFGDGVNEGLVQTHISDPDDPEVKRVLDELNRFSDQVTDLVVRESASLEKDWEATTDDELWNKAAHRLLEQRGDEIFGKEFERQELFYAVREMDDHRKRYFSTIAEVDDLSEQVRSRLLRAYNELIVDSQETKDLPVARDSSSSSESPAAETTEDPSGLQDATA